MSIVVDMWAFFPLGRGMADPSGQSTTTPYFVHMAHYGSDQMLSLPCVILIPKHRSESSRMEKKASDVTVSCRADFVTRNEGEMAPPLIRLKRAEDCSRLCFVEHVEEDCNAQACQQMD